MFKPEGNPLPIFCPRNQTCCFWRCI